MCQRGCRKRVLDEGGGGRLAGCSKTTSRLDAEAAPMTRGRLTPAIRPAGIASKQTRFTRPLLQTTTVDTLPSSSSPAPPPATAASSRIRPSPSAPPRARETQPSLEKTTLGFDSNGSRRPSSSWQPPLPPQQVALRLRSLHGSHKGSQIQVLPSRSAPASAPQGLSPHDTRRPAEAAQGRHRRRTRDSTGARPGSTPPHW